MTNIAVQLPVVTGIIQANRDLAPDAARHLQDKVREWGENPSKPLILGRGICFRQMLPDGTLEPDFPVAFETEESIEFVSTRDWLPYIFGAGGWIAAIVAILVR